VAISVTTTPPDGNTTTGSSRCNCNLITIFNYCLNWQGVPIRVEIGPRDLQNRQVITKSRDLVDKETISMAMAVDRIGQLMEEMHDRLFTKYVQI
jgi:prolyl-tRNA synthetase